MLISVIYLIFISLGLPDSLLGSGWPKMHEVFDVPSFYAGYVSMTISFMTIISALLSPNIMALALRKAGWNEGYRWTAYIQMSILLVCIISLPLWKKGAEAAEDEKEEAAGIKETLRVPALFQTNSATDG